MSFQSAHIASSNPDLFGFREDIGEDFTETGPPERLFCDICDVFDEHDTADCPQQATEEHVESSHGGQRGVERPYCDNCEGKLITYVKLTDAVMPFCFSVWPLDRKL